MSYDTFEDFPTPDYEENYFINRDCFYRDKSNDKIYYYKYSNLNDGYFTELPLMSEVKEITDNLDDQINNEKTGLRSKLLLLDEQINNKSTGLIKKLSILNNQINDEKEGLSTKVYFLDNQINNEEEGLIYQIQQINSSIKDILIEIANAKTSVVLVDVLPKSGEEDIIYKEKSTQILWHWDSKANEMKMVSANNNIVNEVEQLKRDLEDSLKDIQEIDTTIKNFKSEVSSQISETNKTIDTFQDNLDEKTSEINGKIEGFKDTLKEQTDTFNEQIASVNESFGKAIQENSDLFDAKILIVEGAMQDLTDTNNQAIAQVRAEFETLENKTLEKIESIIVKDTFNKLPETGVDNCLYKILDTQDIYHWNSNTSSYELIKAEGTGGIEVIPETDTLPSKGESDMLYKTLLNEKVWTWNESTNEFVEIGAGNFNAAGGGIIIVETKEELYELEGQIDTLYRVTQENQFYYYDPNTTTYEKMGQGGNGTEEEGYKITFTSKVGAQSAIIKGEKSILKFIYSSINQDGIKDGNGIGTLTINDVKKSNPAILQGDNELDITDYLTLGQNLITLTVMNTEGKTKSLVYSVEYIDLYLTTNVKSMDIYNSETAIPFQITGSGTKKLYYYMDDVLLDEEEVVSTNVYSHTYRVPMQVAGDHILKIHAEREINNITVSSNTLVIGMMFITKEMVDTFILSSFEQKESAQGEIITIPYMVYNPFLEKSKVNLTIYNEDGSVYGTTKSIEVDQTVQYWVTQDYPAGKVTFEIQAHSDSGVDAVKTFKMDIAASTFGLSVIRDSLALEFTAAGRSNAEANPEHWSYTNESIGETYEGSFERFAWSSADGWI